jgi:hypothetical protein
VEPNKNKTIFHIADEKKTDVLKIEKTGNNTYVFTVRDRSISLSVEYVAQLRKVLDNEV